ncbi:MAG: hypothetical protein U0401_07065 [Anaerolineae bacterium]
MPADELIQAKLYRLEELRKYQSYYGPNTPYPVILEINDLEVELQRLLQSKATRSTSVAKKKVVKKKKKSQSSLWKMSGRTFDAVATIGFIGLVFLFGTIIFATYVKTRPAASAEVASASFFTTDGAPRPTLRPTFTPTPVDGALLTTTGGANDSTAYLPTPGEVATEVPTPVPTLTPSATSVPTEAPLPTDTPTPEPPPPPPVPQVVVQSAPAQPAAASAPPAATPTPAPPPAPAFPFNMAEQGNREFQRTNYHVITIYAAIVSEGNVPIGGLKIVGDHTPSGMHVESGMSDWGWSAVNCLECDYVKQGNVKFEPGTFADGVWNIYVADAGGKQLSPAVPLSYSADPEKWVWDFIIFRKN